MSRYELVAGASSKFWEMGATRMGSLVMVVVVIRSVFQV